MSETGDSKSFGVKKNHRVAIADLMTVKVYEVVGCVLEQPQECIRIQEVTLLDDTAGSFEVSREVCSGQRQVNGVEFFLYQATLKIDAIPVVAEDVRPAPGLIHVVLLLWFSLEWLRVLVSHQASN
eukprot:s6193_g3.t1